MKIIFIILFFPLAIVAQMKTTANKAEVTFGIGELANDSKTIDADELGYFNGGAALVKKGQAIGLINAKGDFLVPYGKYDFDISSWNSARSSLNNGMFLFNIQLPSGKVNTGIINYQGKIIASNLIFYALNVGEAGQLAFIKESSGKSYFIDKDGKKTLTNITADIERSTNFSEGLSASIDFSKTPQIGGYINYNGDLVIPRVYVKQNVFSGGVAIVAKTDQFNTIKYGVINNKGQEVFPFILTKEPSNLYNGYTLIYRVNDPDYSCVIINKEGKIIIKLTRAQILKYGAFERFINGYFFSRLGAAMDTSGNIFSQDAFCNEKYSVPVSVNISYANDFSDVFSRPGKIRVFGRTSSGGYVSGVLDLVTGKSLLSNNFWGNKNLYFDPVSGLSYVEYISGKNPNGSNIIRKGYINEDGKFVIVKAADSKW